MTKYSAFGNIGIIIYQEDFSYGETVERIVKGGIYHVIARGNNKEYIFKENVDKGYFIKQIKETTAGMGYKVFGFVLMDNHYHIIVQTFDKKLQDIMHQINNKHSKYFNYKYKRVGHVFQGRYKAILVQDEKYIVGLLRYVHQNPVEAHICNDMDKPGRLLSVKVRFKEKNIDSI